MTTQLYVQCPTPRLNHQGLQMQLWLLQAQVGHTAASVVLIMIAEPMQSSISSQWMVGVAVCTCVRRIMMLCKRLHAAPQAPTIEVPHLLLTLLQLQHLCIDFPDLPLQLTHLHTQLVQMLLLCNCVPVGSSNACLTVQRDLCVKGCLQVCAAESNCRSGVLASKTGCEDAPCSPDSCHSTPACLVVCKPRYGSMQVAFGCQSMWQAGRKQTLPQRHAELSTGAHLLCRSMPGTRPLFC